MSRHHMTANGPIPFTTEEEAQADLEAQAFISATNNRKAEAAKMQRQEAYQVESDPLFFKAQRGEATLQDWLSKVAEIKARYPDPQP